MPYELVPAARTIDLGKDGSKWEHGYVPLNAAAVALKNHKSPGGSGGSKQESIHEVATRNMGSDLTKAKSDQLRTFAQFGHQGSKDELKRRADKRAASKAEFQRTNTSAVNPSEAGKAHLDKLVAEKRAREAKSKTVSDRDKATLKAASADQLVKYRENYGPGTPEHDAINTEIASRLAKPVPVTTHTSIVSLKVTGLEGYGVSDLKRIVSLKPGPHDMTHAPQSTIDTAERELRNRGYIKGPSGAWTKPKARTVPVKAHTRTLKTAKPKAVSGGRHDGLAVYKGNFGHG